MWVSRFLRVTFDQSTSSLLTKRGLRLLWNVIMCKSFWEQCSFLNLNKAVTFLLLAKIYLHSPTQAKHQPYLPPPPHPKIPSPLACLRGLNYPREDCHIRKTGVSRLHLAKKLILYILRLTSRLRTTLWYQKQGRTPAFLLRKKGRTSGAGNYTRGGSRVRGGLPLKMMKAPSIICLSAPI